MKVSVVTPTRAVDDFLAEARRSISGQDSDIAIEHLIVVDDRNAVLPPDGRSGNVHTRFLHNAGTKGPGGARNTALDEASGEIVFFLDADDIWNDDHVSTIVAVYEADPAVDCVSVAGLSFGEGVARPRMTIPDLPQGIIPRHCVAWNPIGGPTGFSFRRSGRTSAVRFKESLYFDDIVFYLELLRNGAVFWRENGTRYWYRRSPGQLISIMPTAEIRASQQLVRRHIDEWTDAGLSRREARLASVQIGRLTGNRLRRPDYGGTIALALLAPRWAIAQISRQMENTRLVRHRGEGRFTSPPRLPAAPGA